jgi:hypothetical protein
MEESRLWRQGEQFQDILFLIPQRIQRALTAKCRASSPIVTDECCIMADDQLWVFRAHLRLYTKCARIRRIDVVRDSFERKTGSPICWKR